MELVLAQPAIIPMVDKLNASVHLRALLTDVLLLGEVLKAPQVASHSAGSWCRGERNTRGCGPSHRIDSVSLLLKRVALVFHGEQFGGVVHGAVAVVVVAHRTVEIVIVQNAVERLSAGGVRPAGGVGDFHSSSRHRGAGANQLVIHLHDTGIAGLDRP
jgi:hypothetical protein